MKHMIETKNIIYDNGYVHDILIISDHKKMTAEELLDKMNSSHSKLKFEYTFEKGI